MNNFNKFMKNGTELKSLANLAQHPLEYLPPGRTLVQICPFLVSRPGDHRS